MLDEMRMRTACCAHVPQRCTSRLSKHLLLTFQEVTPLSKTRNQLYVIAGHKGQPEVVKSKERKGRRRRLQGKAGRGTLAKERPPVFGMMQRGGQVVINLIANVKQKTIEPLIKDTIMPGTLIFTDEYSIYARLHVWGYEHKRVNHGRGEFARDDDGY